MVRIDDYPQLALLAWSRTCREISEEEALALYERNWRFVEPDQMTEPEKDLLDRLVRLHGRGVLNV